MYSWSLASLFWVTRNMLLLRGQLHFHGSPMDIGHGSVYGNCQGSVADCGVWGGGMLEKWVIYGCVTDNSPDNRDATRTLGMHCVACGWPPDTPPWPPAVRRKDLRTCQDNIGMHQDVARTTRMGLRTLRILTVGVYGSLFSRRCQLIDKDILLT